MDGRQYDNQCRAFCAGTQPYYSGSCDKRISTCACPTVLDPVCVKAVRVVKVPFLGTIRIPYSFTVSSPCLAKCQVLNGTFTKGACPGDNLLYDATAYTCGCTFGIQPVCAQIPVLGTNVTALNRCAAQCSGFKVLSEGECKGECICPPDTTGDSDVCVGGTRPFKSACQARCAGAKSWMVGLCKKCLSCPEPKSRKDIVCGENRITFPSACAAECAGVRIATRGGPCKF